jgi:hypothetical protein
MRPVPLAINPPTEEVKCVDRFHFFRFASGRGAGAATPLLVRLEVRQTILKGKSFNSRLPGDEVYYTA